MYTQRYQQKKLCEQSNSQTITQTQQKHIQSQTRELESVAPWTVPCCACYEVARKCLLQHLNQSQEKSMWVIQD